MPKIFHNYGLDIEFMIKKNKIEKKKEKENVYYVHCAEGNAFAFYFI